MGRDTPSRRRALARQFEAETPNLGDLPKSTRRKLDRRRPAKTSGTVMPACDACASDRRNRTFAAIARSDDADARRFRPLRAIDRGLAATRDNARNQNGPVVVRGTGALEEEKRNERTGLLERAAAEGRDFAPRVHGPRRRARRLERSRFRPCWRAPTRSPPKRPGRADCCSLGLAGGSTTDSIDVTHLQRLGDDRRRPRPVQRPRRMGPGRQAASRARRELRAEERRQGLDLQSSQGHKILERPGIRRRRRHLFAEPAPRRHQVRRARADEGGHGRQEARQIPDPDLARRAATPIFPIR